MSGRIPAFWSASIIAVLIAVMPTAHAQTPGDFAGEPDKSMAGAHESFVKGDMNKAADQIHKAAAYVKKEGDKVAKDARGAVKKAGEELDRFGREVKKGAVKSGDQLKKTFAQVDHRLAAAWHTHHPASYRRAAGRFIEGIGGISYNRAQAGGHEHGEPA